MEFVLLDRFIRTRCIFIGAGFGDLPCDFSGGASTVAVFAGSEVVIIIMVPDTKFLLLFLLWLGKSCKCWNDFSACALSF